MAFPSNILPHGDRFNAALGGDLILTLDLKSEATVGLNKEGWQNCLTIINHGPDESIEIQRNGNLLTLDQKSPDDIGNSKVEILVPHHFRRLNLILSDMANIVSTAAPLATTIKSTGDVQGNIYTCNCLADLDGNMSAFHIRMMESRKEVGGNEASERHNLVLMAKGGGAHTVYGDIDRACYLVEDTSTILSLAETNHVIAYGPKERGRYDIDILRQSGVTKELPRIRAVSDKRLAVKRDQMTRTFNWHMRQKAMRLARD